MIDINNSLKPNTLLINPDNNNDRYLIKRLINKGGFSFIYDADMIFYITSKIGEREISRQEVVIKELFYPDKASREEYSNKVIWSDEYELNSLSNKIKEKTLSEALKLCGLSSPNILYIYSALELNNTIYIVTKKIDGSEDFSKILKLDSDTPEKLSLKDALKYFNQICEALQEVHNQNIVHLDIKPENILRDSSGKAILIDFGISVSLVDGVPLTLLGAQTPHYSPPEQSLKEQITFATDIYALGCTLYVFLTGHLVPKYTELISGIENLIAPSYFNPEVTPYLDEVIFKSINLRREERYQTVQEFLDAINSENKYNELINKAKIEFEQRKLHNLQKSIEYISQSERIIPLTEEVSELLYDIRSEIKKLSKDEEIAEQITKANQLINLKKYKQALQILRVVPQNTEINKKIVLIEEQIKKEQIQKLRLEALKYENESKLNEAIEKYKEINLIVNNPKISEKIDELQKQTIENEKFENHLKRAIKFENQLDYNSAFKEYTFAASYKSNQVNIQKKLDFCLSKIEEKERYNSDLEWVVDVEKSDTIDNETINSLISITKKHPNDSYFSKVLLEKQTFWNRKLAKQAFYENDFPNALKLFSKIHPKTDEDEKIISEIKTHSTLEDIKNGFYSGGYFDTIAFLQTFPKSNSRYQEAQNALFEVYFQYAKELHKEKNCQEAKNYFSKIPENSSNYEYSEQYQKFYQAVDAFRKRNFDLAYALFSTITYYELQPEVNSYKSEINHGETELIDDSLLKQAQQKNAEGNWQEALSILEKIDSNSYYYLKVQQLINTIKNEQEKGKPTKAKSGITKYIIIGAVAIGGVFGVKLMTNQSNESENASTPKIESNEENVTTKNVTDYKMTNTGSEDYDYFLYTGNTENNMSADEHGMGKYYKNYNGKPVLISTYNGTYIDGKRNGKGVEEYSQIDIKTGKKDFADRQKTYEGNFKDDYPFGTGKLTMTSGAYIVGEFGGKNAKEAKGKWYDEKGKFLGNLND